MQQQNDVTTVGVLADETRDELEETEFEPGGNVN